MVTTTSPTTMNRVGEMAREPKHLSLQPPLTFNRHIFVMAINFKWPITHFANPDRP